MGNKLFLLLAGVSSVGLSSQAWAQAAPTGTVDTVPTLGSTEPTAANPTPAPAQATNMSAQSSDDIVVTGSRIIKNGNASPSPVTVVTTSDLLKVQPGSTLADSLNTLPALSGSRGSSSNPTSVGSAGAGNGNANQLNLRNLGTIRTLVLLDGKRVAPSLFNGVVDVDIIPQALVQRVDIVTGGVSAVYGSDAVAGVVNYVLNKKLQGFVADISGGITQRGDAPKQDATLAYGTQIGDRLHVEGSYEYHHEGGIDRRSSRAWLQQVGVTGAGTAANPYKLQTGLRQDGFPFGGLITTGALAGQTFKSNGVLGPFTPGATTGTPAIQIGGDGGYWDSSLLARLNSNQLFGRADYEITDTISAYAQLSATIKTNENFAEYGQLSGVSFSRTNAFLSPAIQAAIPTNQPTFKMSELLSQIPRIDATSNSHQYIYTAGVAGHEGGVRWNVDYSHGISKLSTDLANDLNRQKLDYALDAVSSGGQIVCNISVTNPGLANGCVPFNPFGATAASASAIDYVTDTVHYAATTIQDDVSGQVSGSPFSLWAGDVSTALSAEFRKTSFSSTSSSTPSDMINCTGIRFGNCTAGGALNDFQFGASPKSVSQSVWEVAGEVDVPLLKNSVVAKSLDLNGAVRYTHYNTSGSYVTWKVGLEWQVTDRLRLRGTRSRDIRAPTLYDLFAPTSSVPVRPTDLLTNTSPTVPSISPSNPNLRAEIGNAVTAGVVWTPLPRLSFAVDAYDIKISDAITQIDGSTTAYQNACYASGGSSVYCALQVRPNGYADMSAANAVQAWIVQSVNLSQIETKGIDVEANYAANLFGRPASLRLLTAYQPHIYYRQPNVVTIDQGGVGFGPTGLAASPSVRISAFFRIQPVDGFTIDLFERWRNRMKLSGDPTQVFVYNHMGSFATTAVNLAWDMKSRLGQMQVYFNIQNLFDADPPIGAYAGNGTRAGLRDGFAIGDDPRGRSFTAGVRLKL